VTPEASDGTSLTARALTEERVLALVRASLALWQVAATVEPRGAAGGWRLRLDDGREVLVARAPAGIPFRWMVTAGGRERPASSITGLLRVLRASLDRDWRPGRARIAALPPT